MCAKPHNRHCHQVHGQHHGRHHKGHNTVGKQLGARQRNVCVVEALLLMLFTAKCPDNRQAGQNFACDQIEVVNQGLHLLKARHGRAHQHRDNTDNGSHGNRDNPRHTCLCACHTQNTANTQNRRIQHNAQQNDNYHLYLLNVIGRTGDKRRGRKAGHLLVAERYHTGKQAFAQVHRQFGRRARSH